MELFKKTCVAHCERWIVEPEYASHNLLPFNCISDHGHNMALPNLLC